MNLRSQKFFMILLACLLGLNLAADGTVPDEHCPPSLCPSGLVDMGQPNGMIDFTRTTHGHAEDCNDLFCDLLKDPLKTANALTSFTFSKLMVSVVAGTAGGIGQPGLRARGSELQPPPPDTGAASQIPLYIEHLSLII